MVPLSPKRRSELRAEAHRLNPIVFIGDKGLTDEVIAEIDRSLRAHELVKVRAAGGERAQRDIWLETICERLGAHPVQQIGKVFVIYRENLDPVPEPAKDGARTDEGRSGGKRGRPRAEVVSDRGRKAQRARDAEKQRLRDIADMVRKGKIPPKAKFSPAPEEATRTPRPRSRTPSPLPESGPRRRRPRTST